jgi:hypothetical protein
MLDAQQYIVGEKETTLSLTLNKMKTNSVKIIKEVIPMSEFTLKVQAPELAAAISQLAAAISGAPIQHIAAPAQVPAQQPPSPATPVAPTPPPAPTAPPVATAAPVQVQAPNEPPAQAPPPVAPPAPPVVPTAAAPTYNQDQIMTAGAALIDAGKINELMGLLNAFGVQAVTQLKQEQLGAFATELRKLGAQI